MAWTSPRTWTTGEILTASLLNTHLRDDLIYLKGTTGLTVIEGTLCAENSTAAFKHLLRRQGGSTSVWENAGTNNYTETGAFVQAGCVSVSITTAQASNTASVNLPVALSGSLGLCWANIVGSPLHICSAQLGGSTAVTIYLLQRDTSSGGYIAATPSVNWFVYGK